MELRVIFTREQLECINRSDIHSIAKLWFATHPQADKFAEGMIANMRMAAFMDTMVGGLNGNHINEQDCFELKAQESTNVEYVDNTKNTMEFPDDWYRAYDSTGRFLGLYEKIGKKYVPVKMFL